jgi:hypothetical protein
VPVAFVFAQTYDLPLAATPVAPSGLHQAPGYTVATPEGVVAGEVTGVVSVLGAFAVVVGDVAAGVRVVGVVAGVVDGVVGGVVGGTGTMTPISGASLDAAMVRPEHDELSRFLILPHSLLSIDNSQRAFTAIQLPM